MMRRLVAAAGLAALGLTLVVPLAWAHDDPNVHTLAWGASPESHHGQRRRPGVFKRRGHRGRGRFHDGVKSWDVVIRPVNGGQPSTCHEDLAQKDGQYPPRVYINCPWDTTRAKNHTLPGSTDAERGPAPAVLAGWQSQDLGPSVNGKYTIEITAYNSGQRVTAVS